MSGLDSGNSKDYSKYDGMSTESLEELLRLDAELPDGEGPDIDEILYISEVIAKREKEHPTGRYPEIDVDAAWENFQTKYLPYMTDGRSLYDFDDEEPSHTEEENAGTDNPSPTSRKRISLRGRRHLKRVVSIAAVIAVLLGLMTATAYAMGYDLWGVIAQWTKDTFTFVSVSKANEPSEPGEGDTIGDGEYADLQAALDAYGITEQLAPNWIPNGFTVGKVVVNDNSSPDYVVFNTCYRNDAKSIMVQIKMHQNQENTSFTTWQKDDMDVDTVIIADCTFYTMQNAGRECAVWINGPFECTINGNISSEELLKIIESIFN
ncbi:DUF4367 domain-containing protein [bacterium 1xD42-67]|nr:DUF4367 domain-containing protein [bacterium 1xD42-67]